LSNVAMVPPIIRRLVEDLISDNKAKHQAAKESIQILEADERDLVLSLLSNHIERNQDDKTGYEAFRLLIEWDIPGSITELEKALQAVPSEKIPVPFGLSLINLQKGKPEVAGALEPIISRLAASETPIGKVVMKHLRKG